MPRFFISHYRRQLPRAEAMQRWYRSPLIVGAIGTGLLALLYVWQMTLVSMGSYVYNDLAKEKSAYLGTIQRTQFEALEHQSLARVEERLQELQLVRDTKTEYVTREDVRLSLSVR